MADHTDETVTTDELDALYLKDRPAAPVVDGFDTAALFLLSMQYPNLFEPASAATGTLECFRCKGCRAVVGRGDRERHFNRHKKNKSTYAKGKKMATDTETKPVKPKATPKPTAKDLGVPDVYLGAGGNFRPGLDARLKSDLINAIIDVENKGALVKWTADEAKKLFAQFPQWKGFLIRKQEIVAAKAAAATERAAEKAESAKVKAEAKKAAAAAKTAASGKTDTGVTPDPKPSAKK